MAPSRGASPAEEVAKALRSAVAAASTQPPRAARSPTAAVQAQSALLGLRQSASTTASLAALLEAAAEDALPGPACCDAMWAVGTLSRGNGSLEREMEALAAALSRLAKPLPLHSASHAAWALGVTRHDCAPAWESLLKAAEQAACGPARARSPADLRWRGAQVRSFPAAYMLILSSSLKSKPAPILQASALVWASAVLCPPQGGVTPRLAAALLRSMRSPGGGSAAPAALPGNFCAVAAWALAAADAADSAPFARVWLSFCTAAAEGPQAPRLSAEALAQLHQASLSLRASALPPLPQPLADAAAAAWARTAAKPPREATSGKQAQVGAALTSLGLSPRIEAVLPDAGGYRVDFALPATSEVGPCRGIVLEVDGPTHYSRNSRLPLGSTRMKWSHLRAAGYAVAAVPVFEWDRLRGPADRSAFLAAKLERAEAAFEASPASTIDAINAEEVFV